MNRLHKELRAKLMEDMKVPEEILLQKEVLKTLENFTKSSVDTTDNVDNSDLENTTDVDAENVSTVNDIPVEDKNNTENEEILNTDEPTEVAAAEPKKRGRKPKDTSAE